MSTNQTSGITDRLQGREERLENALRALLRTIDNLPWRDAAGMRLGDAVPAVEDARALLK